MGRPDARAAAFFDVDRTTASSNLLDAYLDYALEGKKLLGRGIWLGTFVPKLPLYALLDWTDRVRFIRGFFRNYRGMTLEDLESWANRKSGDYWRRRLFGEARAAVEWHRERGHKIVLLTGGLMEMVRPLGDLLEVDEVMASRGKVTAGRFTGEMESEPLSGPGKAKAARFWADGSGVDLSESYAYADDMSDLPLLELVGHPIVVNPERRLEKLARAKGWPVRRWTLKGETAPSP